LVPKIVASAAYKRGGAVIVAFALVARPGASSTTAAPALPPSVIAPTGGSAPAGALLLSPHAARGRTVSTTYDPYSVLRTVEDLLGYKPLAHARGAASFAGAMLG
jgi:hypothetical protein